MTFKKGAPSANPKGRAAETEQKRRVAANMLEHLVPKAVEVYEALLNEGDGQTAKDVLDRCLGKPAQAVSMEHSGSVNLVAVIKDG